ncbi:phenazine biosynthesis protein PhzF family [Sinosporangium album]|uniref:Phenazine biosynthesis protein PhzF family n=1 Tax=Sinosporangium album TaxID=504805 RepID=A0A1G7VG61_9ACTN|nr:PhzF family phenazine biosynthesis protein [Sinosporangium album]SDG58806.1 phenazine biosynthesis protein PhzF family [Sinosporangium album]
MRLFTVDAFTDRPFRGNPAAVCLLTGPMPDAWMQDLAAEMNLSETAFLLGDTLRWFTPAVEVALCGHATLATAHVLYSQGATGRLEFTTKSGTLATERTSGGLIGMDFPAKPATQAAPPPGLLDALRVEPLWVGRSQFDMLVEVDSEETVLALSPDIDRLADIDARGVIVTARATRDGADFVSRFFAPRAGVAEDPVTGSAHCVLSPYWTAKLGRDSLVGAQVSKRGGTVRTTLRGDRVDLAGHAVTIWSGDLHL